MNNRFVPIDAARLRKQDETGHQLLRHVNHQMKMPNSQTNPSYLNYLQNNLNQELILKITIEEEKYVYLIKKFREHRSFVNIFKFFSNSKLN